MADLMKGDPLYASFMRIIFVPGVLFALAQLSSGIGLLKSREWARKLAIAVALYSALAGMVLGYINMTHVTP